jgi:hypothetical protein
MKKDEIDYFRIILYLILFLLFGIIIITCKPAKKEYLIQSSGISFINKTGYYGTGNKKYIPAGSYDKDAPGLAEIRINVLENGIVKRELNPNSSISNLHSSFRNPHSAIHIPQSAIPYLSAS